MEVENLVLSAMKRVSDQAQLYGWVNVSYLQNEDNINSGYCKDSIRGFALNLTQHRIFVPEKT